MKTPVAILLLSASAWSATVQGVIFDEESKNPMARAKVSLVPLPGNPAKPVSLLASERGLYAFADVQPGWYLVRAERVGYAVSEYGQSRPGRPGTPFEIANDSASESRPIVMRRLAVITGTVVDDNATGIAGWPVNVYTARQPIRRIAQGTADDRGDFRIGELAAGAYIVRSGGGGLEDSSTLVPAYYKFGTTVAAAEPVRVRLGETQGFIVLHTMEGQLYELTGAIVTPNSAPARLTLITDTGRNTVASAAGEFTATGVPPGMAELLVQGSGCAGYQRIMVDRNMFARVACTPLTPPVIDWQIGAQPTVSVSYPVIMRRIDLDGPLPEQTFAPNDTIPPGRWELSVRGATAHYVVSIQGDEKQPSKSTDGWFGIDVGNSSHIRITLSAKPASISGVVASLGKPVIGAPVYMELFSPDAAQPLQSWTARTDTHGSYAFNGLPPGSYRLISSFEIDYDDPSARNKSAIVNLREGDTLTQALDMILQ